ncbi:hypothetical protein ZWY2020_029898 [Hordeum vulgare]|nr:hypothetical protein ZWY2020_029898 [Hordeum vulgare]
MKLWIVSGGISHGIFKIQPPGGCGFVFELASCACLRPFLLADCTTRCSVRLIVFFLICNVHGLNSCGYLRWMDGTWHRRSRMVIEKLGDDTKKLQIPLFQKELEIHRMKNERNKLNERWKIRKRKYMFLVVIASVVTCLVFAFLSRVVVFS